MSLLAKGFTSVLEVVEDLGIPVNSANITKGDEYWGYLITPDNGPTPIFEQFLLALAAYISRNAQPWDTTCLTPAKLAAFYRLVGGKGLFDPLFLETPHSSIAFLYRETGCFFTLQPDGDPFTPPTIPALTPHGFVRWQTFQTLLEPREHVPFLQDAAKRFSLRSPKNGRLFPTYLPRDALPFQPDPAIEDWYEEIRTRKRSEARAEGMNDMPPRPQKALTDEASSRDSDEDTRTVVSADVASSSSSSSRPPGPPHRAPTYPNIRTSQPPRPPHRAPTYPNIRTSEPPRPPHRAPTYPNIRTSEPSPQFTPERRRSSLPDNSRGHSTSRSRDERRNTSFHPSFQVSRSTSRKRGVSISTSDTSSTSRNSRPPSRKRGDSDLSTDSKSTSDTSSRSHSPARRHSQTQPPTPSGGRRHSASLPPRRPVSHPRGYNPHHRQRSGPSGHRDGNRRSRDDEFEYIPYSSHQIANSGRDTRRGHSRGDRADERERGRSRRSGDRR